MTLTTVTDCPARQDGIARARAAWLTNRSPLTVVWLAVSGFFAFLLLHPGVPVFIREVIARPNRIAAETLEYSAHFAVFFVMTELALIAREVETRRALLVILTIAGIAGAIAETVQRWVPGRGVDVFDALCNITGVIVAGIVYRRLFMPHQ